jgi:hypothetical protein
MVAWFEDELTAINVQFLPSALPKGRPVKKR